MELAPPHTPPPGLLPSSSLRAGVIANLVTFVAFCRLLPVAVFCLTRFTAHTKRSHLARIVLVVVVVVAILQCTFCWPGLNETK